MSRYSTVLVGIDLTDEAPEVLAGAQRIAGRDAAQLHAIVAIPPFSYAYTGFEAAGIVESVFDLETRARANAERALASLCESIGVDDDHRYVVLGRASDEISAKASAISADLIVVGSHGRSGAARLIGSTALDVMRKASCDVYLVRVQGE